MLVGLEYGSLHANKFILYKGQIKTSWVLFKTSDNIIHGKMSTTQRRTLVTNAQPRLWQGTRKNVTGKGTPVRAFARGLFATKIIQVRCVALQDSIFMGLASSGDIRPSNRCLFAA
jgi:hypothetical protein